MFALSYLHDGLLNITRSLHKSSHKSQVSRTNQIAALGYACTNPTVAPHANHVGKLGYHEF